MWGKMKKFAAEYWEVVVTWILAFLAILDIISYLIDTYGAKS